LSTNVESFRIALDGEIKRWSGFARALRKPEREAFDELLAICRKYVSECSCANIPITFEHMLMSILLFQQNRITQLEQELWKIKPEEANPSKTQGKSVPVEPKPNISSQPNAIGGGQSRLF